MNKQSPKRLFTDSYETEIKVSLVLLICLLLSLNFLSAYSLRKARQSQHDEHILNMEMVKETARNFIEQNGELPELSFLQDLAKRARVDKIELINREGYCLMTVGAAAPEMTKKSITITAPVRSKNGDVAYYLVVKSLNREGETLERLVLIDSLIRIAGLFAALIVGFYFIKTIMNPYKKMRKEASRLEIAQVDFENYDDMEYVVRTFHHIIKELKEKESLLKSMYDNSEKRADSLARYNEYILGGISSGVIICDNSGIITRFNRAAGNILNYDHIQCQGRHHADVFGKNHHISIIFQDALRKNQTVSRSEFEMSIDGGERRWIGLSSSLIRDNNNNNIGAAVLLTDLTKIKKLQEISDFTEKMAALGEMAAGLAHEFRNSVAAIMGFGKLMKKIVPENDKANEIAEMIINETRTTEEMLRRFLTFAKPLKVVPERVNLGQLIGDSLKASKEGCPDKDVRVDFTDNSGGLLIDADPVLLKNAFGNLFLNAFQAMDYNGKLDVNIDLETNDSQVSVDISDNGAGIADDDLPKIFNPFFTTKDKGTGLGLALVKKIITGHCGNIDVVSNSGNGTTFRITLPLNFKLNTDENLRIPDRLPAAHV